MNTNLEVRQSCYGLIQLHRVYRYNFKDMTPNYQLADDNDLSHSVTNYNLTFEDFFLIGHIAMKQNLYDEALEWFKMGQTGKYLFPFFFIQKTNFHYLNIAWLLSASPYCITHNKVIICI